MSYGRLINPQETIRLLKEENFHFQKRYGQNFLIDERVLQDIIESAHITRQDAVLEIGPGIGTMTQALLESAGTVIAAEIDANLIPILKKTLSSYDNAVILHADALKLDFASLAQQYNEGRPLKVCANLPYYITTPILMSLFESHAPIESITIMIQKEVASRIKAQPGTKDYGALSLVCQYHAKPVIVREVPPNCFIPRPGVSSAVIRLDLYSEPPVSVQDEKYLFKLIRSSFTERRKTLVNSLANTLGISKAQTAEALRVLGFPENIRGEALSLSDFAKLSDLLQSKF